MIYWRKSSHSQDEVNTECIEVSTNTPATTLVRDSKNPHGPRLVLTRHEFANLLHQIKTGGAG